MTGDARVRTPAGTWRAVAVFVALTALLSGIFWAFINFTQTVTALYIFALMWMPGLAAVVTWRIVGRPLSTLGLGRWNGRFVLIAYAIPIAYCLVASLGTWLFASAASRTTISSRRWRPRWGCRARRTGW
jgi:uncharacterized protein